MPPKLPADQRYVPVEPRAPASPIQATEPFPEAATDLESVLRLANAMRAVLINLGFAREE